MLTQLHTPIPMDSPKGKCFAHFALDYGQEHSLLFVTFVNSTGECWIWPQKDVRLDRNITMGVRVD